MPRTSTVGQKFTHIGLVALGAVSGFAALSTSLTSDPRVAAMIPKEWIPYAGALSALSLLLANIRTILAPPSPPPTVILEDPTSKMRRPPPSEKKP